MIPNKEIEGIQTCSVTHHELFQLPLSPPPLNQLLILAIAHFQYKRSRIKKKKTKERKSKLAEQKKKPSFTISTISID
jgi:hypothetical protein